VEIWRPRLTGSNWYDDCINQREIGVAGVEAWPRHRAKVARSPGDGVIANSSRD
jgi:hypothetical protein